MENGQRLSEETGANVDIVSLFAVFHDSQRRNESSDPGQGQCGANFAARLRGHVFDLSDQDFDLLYQACAGHTDELTHADITIQTCWDSDLLDLGRVGVKPHASLLCTDLAKTNRMIQWADGKASFGVVPELVIDDWGIEL